MQLIFEHLQINGITGNASAYIPGPAPESKLDRASYFEIQASFYTLPMDTPSSMASQSAAQIPGKNEVVHINYIWEQEVLGSIAGQKVQWPTNGEYRPAFTRMLAHMLAQRTAELPG